jgi:flagellar protein FlaJ
MLRFSSLVPSSLVQKSGGLQLNIAKAGMRISFQVYVGLMAFVSLLAGVVTFGFSFAILSIIGIFPFSLVFALLAGVGGAFASIGMCFLYPSLGISSRARKIDANLPLVANFMAVLASSGMPPERIFRSLANVGDEFGVGQEVRRAIGDIELNGMDLNGALKAAALRSASKKFGKLLDGVVTTSHMGGDLAGFLRESSEAFKKLRMASMKSYVDSLGGIAEVYVSILIALPLALVVMLSIMSFMGGGASLVGNIDPQVLLLLLTFVVIPAGTGVILLLSDSMSPPR